MYKKIKLQHVVKDKAEYENCLYSLLGYIYQPLGEHNTMD